MNRPRTVAVILLGFLLVVGGAMLAIYLTQGGNGDSEDIPGNPNEVVRPFPFSTTS